ASARAASSADVPPRYHHSQATKRNDTATQTSDQTPASRIVTACAPWRFMARKSIASATRTKAAKSDHNSGVPMEIIEETLLLRPGRGRMTDWSKVLAGLAARGRVNARGYGTGQAVDCRIDRCRSDDAAARELGFRAGYSPGEEREFNQRRCPGSTKAPGRGRDFCRLTGNDDVTAAAAGPPRSSLRSAPAAGCAAAPPGHRRPPGGAGLAVVSPATPMSPPRPLGLPGHRYEAHRQHGAPREASIGAFLDQQQFLFGGARPDRNHHPAARLQLVH